MDNRKRQWTEDDIRRLIGQEESIRLEFKSGALFDKQQPSWIADLSKEVSAFANTEGGTLVLGLREEKKANMKVAGDVDGVPNAIGREQIQRLIEGHVSPYLTGLHVYRVPLTSLPDRAVLVVDVPQGTTAYQADDGRYYGRSEVEVKYLPDHEIRLRMARGKIARGSINFRLRKVIPGTTQEAELRQKYGVALEAFKNNAEDAARRYPEILLDLMAARFLPDVVAIDLVLRNDSELTVRAPAIQLTEHRSASLSDGWTIQGSTLPPRLEMPREVIYPGDERTVEGSLREFRCRREATINPGEYLFHWKVFFDNSPPSEGDADLGEFIQRARKVAEPQRL